jgi:hypothetical protein
MGAIKNIVLLSGPIAVGKTSLRNVLVAQHEFEYVRSSNYLRELVQRESGKEKRSSLQDLGDELDLRTDYRWLLEDVAMPGFAAAPQIHRWLVDAVRKSRQIAHFRERFGTVVLHVHLTASEEILQARYKSRMETMPEVADLTSYDAAINHDNEKLSRGLIDIADLVIDTGCTPPDLIAQQVLCAYRVDR